MNTRQKRSGGVHANWSVGVLECWSFLHSATPSLHHSISPSLHHSITPSLRSRDFRHAFSLIELIGVLAVMAILAGALVPALIRQMDKVAGDQESAALKSFGDALQQSIMRNRSIPTDT